MHRIPEKGRVYWFCRCVCGTERRVRAEKLVGGKSSCGCERNRKFALVNRTHGVSSSHPYTFVSWAKMKERCTNSKHPHSRHYLRRGITICARWLGESGPLNFLADMGERPKGLSLDRKDNDKGYWCGKSECSDCGPLGREPNCRWATEQKQKRNTRQNVLLTFQGETLCMAEWAERTGINQHVIRNRYAVRKWSVEKTLTTPVEKRAKRKAST